LEVHPWNRICFGQAVNDLDIPSADFAERGGRGNRGLPLPAKKRTDIAHGLQPGYVHLEKDAINGTAPKRYVIPE
jgi:hypothetical protein